MSTTMEISCESPLATRAKYSQTAVLWYSINVLPFPFSQQVQSKQFTQAAFSTAYFIVNLASHSNCFFQSLHVQFLGNNLPRFLHDVLKVDIDVIPAILSGLIIVLPVSMLKSLRSLAFVSTFGNVALLYGLVALFWSKKCSYFLLKAVVFYYDGVEIHSHGPSDISQFSPGTFFVFIGQSVCPLSSLSGSFVSVRCTFTRGLDW